MSSSPSSSSPSPPSITQSESSNLAMALSSLSLNKENSPPSSSTTSATTTTTLLPSSRKRKACCPHCWYRVPLEDITHLYHPNTIVNGDVKEVVEPMNASLSRVDGPMERRIVMVKWKGMKVKVNPVEMKSRVSLRKEFR